jgi:serine/threonine protein kinase
MLSESGTLKLVDFGTAIKLERGKRANSFIGTPYW